MPSTKFDVDISGFLSGIAQGKQSVKTLNAEMKVAEAEFKATGNAEQLAANKSKILTSQIAAQNNVIKQAQAALKAMDDNGIKPTDASYQKLNATLLSAQAGMFESQAALNALSSGAQEAAESADELTTSVNGIGKKISLEQVIGGIDKITNGLENAAKKAVHLGEEIWNNVMSSARWADDTATMALMYGIDLDTFQRMQKLVTNGMDTSVESILKSQSKLKKGIGEGSKGTIEALDELGIKFRELSGDEGVGEFVSRDAVEVFWEAGKAIMALGDEYKQEAMAQDLFGRSWKELIPLFDQYDSLEEYKKAMESVQVNSEEDVQALADLNDKVSELKGNLETLSRDILAQMAPALTDAANALNGMLTSVLEYLKTEKGQELLDSMSKSISTLFEDLGKIDPETAVQNFTKAFDALVSGIKWVADNKDSVITALEAIVAGWAGLKLTGGILEIANIINGISGLKAGAASAAGSAAGTAWGGAFASAVMAAAPWLIGLYTLLHPAGSADNNMDMLFDPVTHKLTDEGKEAGIEMTYEDFMSWTSDMMQQWSAQGQSDKIWQNQMEYGTAWVAMTEEQAEAVQKFYDAFRKNGDFTDADWDAYESAFEGQADLFDKVDELFNHFVQASEGQMPEDLPEDMFRVLAEPELPEDVNETLVSEIGVLNVPVNPIITGGAEDLLKGLGGGQHANGLPFVPYDGYLATLHRGEMVVPAREIASRSYNSNLYVENMNMSGGMDAAGLAAKMAEAQRRTLRAYGS